MKWHQEFMPYCHQIPHPLCGISSIDEKGSFGKHVSRAGDTLKVTGGITGNSTAAQSQARDGKGNTKSVTGVAEETEQRPVLEDNSENVLEGQRQAFQYLD